MCGVVAVLANDVSVNSYQLATSLLSAIGHRGPDESGYLNFPVNAGLTIGANRLSVIGRASKHITPFHKKGRELVIGYNGEVYNYREIRAMLQKDGVTFETETDTEVFYEAWAKWGESALQRLNGMFAVVIYDPAIQAIWLVRDIAGQKPLYYLASKNIFAVASEAKAFRELPIQLEITHASENEFYEAFQHHHKSTLYKNVYQVLPAHIVKYDLTSGKIHEREYWRPSFGGFVGTFADAAEELESLIRKSVGSHSNAEVKHGLYLSDGLDSNVLHRIGRFENTYSYTSDSFAEKDLYRRLPEIVEILDFPIASLSSFPLYELARMAACDGCTVVLSGEGADELFGGYVRYLLPLTVAELWESKSNYQPLFSKAVPNPSRIFSKVTCRDRNEEFVYGLFEEIKSQTPDLMTAMQYFDFKYIMPSLLNMGDRISSSFSLENRCPFLSRDIIEFGFSIPASYKYEMGVQKRLLHEVGGRLGYSVKPQKTGLTIDFNNYLHRNDWDRSSYFSILNYLWVNMFNKYRLRLS